MLTPAITRPGCPKLDWRVDAHHSPSEYVRRQDTQQMGTIEQDQTLEWVINNGASSLFSSMNVEWATYNEVLDRRRRRQRLSGLLGSKSIPAEHNVSKRYWFDRSGIRRRHCGRKMGRVYNPRAPVQAADGMQTSCAMGPARSGAGDRPVSDFQAECS